MLLEKEVVFYEDLEHISGKRIKDIKKEQAEAAKTDAETTQDSESKPVNCPATDNTSENTASPETVQA